MRKMIVGALCLLSLSVHAAVGVSLGAREFADDGFPNIGPNEQAKFFSCTGNGTGVAAQQCALEKCFKHFKIDAATAKTKYLGSTGVIGGHCTRDGWAERKGHSVGFVGPKGDNQFIMSKALGDPDKKTAMEYARSNNFPVDKATKVLDYWDDIGYDASKPITLK